MKPNIIRWLLLVTIIVCAACGPQVLRPKGSMQPVPEVKLDELEGAYTPRRIALLVGINSFEDKNWRPLMFAVDDAGELSSFLDDDSKGRFDEVVVLTSPGETTRDAIMKAFARIAKINTNPRDTVMVYFSTHGTLERDANGNLRQYLVASDTRFDDIPNSAIDITDIQTRFRMLRSRRKVLILATCHSGSGKSAFDSRMAEELGQTKAGFFVKPLEVVSEASVILSACAWGETAREDKKLKHDIYTHFFIEALRNFDPNGDGAITVSEAHDYAREKTYYYTKGKQRATALSDILGSDPIVLSGKVRQLGKPALFSYDNSMEDIEVRVDGQVKGKLPGSVVVEPGIRLITFIKPGAKKVLFKKRVRFVRGKRVDARELIKMVNIVQSAGVGVSYRSFISGDTSDSLYGAMLTYGMLHGRPGPWKSTRWNFGLYAGNETQSLEYEGVSHDADLTRVDLEGALLWEYKLGWFRLAGGPTVGMLYLDREFAADIDDSSQYNITGATGALINFEFMPYQKWTIGLENSISVIPLSVDDSMSIEFGYGTALVLRYWM